MTQNFYVEFENTPFPRTSHIAPEPYRLNWRCEICLTRNREAIKGKKILDLGSHDGRFSYACLKLGAKHVTGVEGKEHLVKSAIDNLTGLGYTREQFTFIQGDIFDYLAKVKPQEFDTILCLAVFDHTIRQIELVRELQRIQPAYLILDIFTERGAFINPSDWLKRIKGIRFKRFTGVPGFQDKARSALNIAKGKPCLVFRTESHEGEGATIDPIDIAARPTISFVELIFRSHGFILKRLKWDEKGYSDRVVMRDYKGIKRVSYIARLVE